MVLNWGHTKNIKVKVKNTKMLKVKNTKLLKVKNAKLLKMILKC